MLKKMTDFDFPSKDTVLGYYDSLSNWGRWGENDRLGTLNFITPEVRKKAAALISSGQVISLSQNLDPNNPDPLGAGMGNIQRFMQLGEVSHIANQKVQADAVTDFIGIEAHGSNTHLDGLGHYAWKGRNYNGFDASETNSIDGSQALSIHQAEHGIVSSAVILDICGLHGVQWLETSYAITPDDLLAAEKRQGVTVEPGDVLLVHTGHVAKIRANGPAPASSADTPVPPGAGLHASCLPFLHDRGVSALGSDTVQDVQPSGYDDWDLFRPIHSIGIVALGLWLIDNMDLTEAVDKCREVERWKLFFALLPWKMVGVTSAATNPVAIF